jgi:hypothetical protein
MRCKDKAAIKNGKQPRVRYIGIQPTYKSKKGATKMLHPFLYYNNPKTVKASSFSFSYLKD